METETIADIVREMWKMQERTSIVLAVRGYAKRIDEAYKRDTGDCEACLHKHPQCADCSKVAAVEIERNDLRRENDRLTAAYNNAVTADVNHAMEIAGMKTLIGELHAEIDVLRKEIAKKDAALKPVLDCHLCDGGQQVVSDALCAIREAQEIMKGETKWYLISSASGMT